MADPPMPLPVGERLFEYAERLVADDPEIGTVVRESTNQNTDLDACAARHAIAATPIAEDVVHYLLEAGWSPPTPANTALLAEVAASRDLYRANWDTARTGNTVLLEQLGRYQDLLSSIWLYVSWRYVTKQLTTEQKELWADAVDKVSALHDPDDPVKVDRWWADPSGPSTDTPPGGHDA